MSNRRDSQRVVVLGQIARDLVLRVSGIPGRGSSGPVGQRLEMLGGKGANQAVGVAQLGLPVTLVGAVGDDEAAIGLLRQAAADGIDTSLIARRPHTASGLIVSIVDADGWRYLEDLPTAVQVSCADVDRAALAIQAAGTVVVQLQQPAASALAAAELGRRAGCRVILDGAPAEDGYQQRLLAAADVIRADAHEAELLTGQPLRNGTDAIRAGERLLDQGPSLVALAAGADGNAIVWPGGSVLIPLSEQPVADTTGAGDAFVAGLVASLVRGHSPARSGRNAAAAAARVVERLGGRPALTPAIIGDSED
ncbi:MAG TPA: PfkB family carbohydrate kinase [Streptosporangiaceae bacterium]|jgi:ribokinase